MTDARAYFNELNWTYSSVHKTKEDLFWTTYMATSDDQAGFARAERAYKEFISDPAQLRATRDHVSRLQRLPSGEERDSLLHGLKGWLALFEANIIDSDEGRALMRDIIDAEAALFASRRELKPRHINEHGESGGHAQHARNQSGDQSRGGSRRSSFDAFHEIEQWVWPTAFWIS
jgi:hypothetical protein